MITTVCELPNKPDALEAAWNDLKIHVQEQETELLLLPEMPFHHWLPGTSGPDAQRWEQSVRDHEQWIERFRDLGPRIIAGTRPVIREDSRRNSGFIWKPEEGLQPVHEKYYLPDEPDYWEATWYSRGDGHFNTVATRFGKMGFLICTELWFTKHAWDYGKQNVRVILCPRATPATTREKWISGGIAAAVVSGAYCLSSNLTGEDFAGTGWIIEPEDGEVLGTTTADDPFLTLDIDLDRADRAKQSYPRYVKD